MNQKRYLIFLLMIFILAGISVFAQTRQTIVVSDKKTAPASPYKIGESLTYEGKYSRSILRGIEVADLTFTVTQAPEGDDFLIKSEAKSKGTLTKLFNFKFYQRLESFIDNDELRVSRSIRRDEQGDRIRESESLFDYENKKVTYYEIDPNDPARPPRRVAAELGTNAQDLVSGVYMLRALPLAVGKTFEITVSDSGLIYNIPVKITAREKQKTVLGKVWCFRIEPEVFGENRPVEQEGSMIIWITDDTRRLPVRAQVNSSIGKIEVKLKKVENIK